MRATHATRKKIEFPYTLDDTPLADTPSTSYLGVELSSDLRWNKQVKKTVPKETRRLACWRGTLGTVRNQSRTWPTKPSCSLNWNMLLLSGTHSLRTTSANWKLYRGGQLDLSATATGRLQVWAPCWVSWAGHCWNSDVPKQDLGCFTALYTSQLILMLRHWWRDPLTRKANEVQYTRHFHGLLQVLVHPTYHHPMEWHSCNEWFQSVQIRTDIQARQTRPNSGRVAEGQPRFDKGGVAIFFYFLRVKNRTF